MSFASRFVTALVWGTLYGLLMYGWYALLGDPGDWTKVDVCVLTGIAGAVGMMAGSGWRA